MTTAKCGPYGTSKTPGGGFRCRIYPNKEVEEVVYDRKAIRGLKVMLDFHLVSLYEVETRVLKQQVKRNLSRFPDDFMFQLSDTEWKELITNCDNLGTNKFSPATPFAFTEQRVAMLSGILRSERAIHANIAIMRAFVKMREFPDENKELKKKIDLHEV